MLDFFLIFAFSGYGRTVGSCGFFIFKEGR